MNVTFLIVYSSQIDRDELIKYIETLPGHKLWFYTLPNSVFVNSSLGVKELSDYIHKKYKVESFLVTQLTGARYWGSLPESQWDKFIHPVGITFVKD